MDQDRTEPVEIVASGLLLRPWRAGDAADVHRACQDPDIQRWTTVPAPYRLEHATGFVSTMSPRAWATGTGAPFAVCDAATGGLLGSCALVTIDSVLRSAEVGYWTAPWARGRGVAVRATRAVCRWAFAELGMRRIIWQAEVGNHASRLVALRAGFTVEGRLRLAHRHPRGGLDGWIGSLLPADLADEPAGAEAEAGQPETAEAGGDPGRAAPGSPEARRAAVFGAPQPILYAGRRGGGELRLRPLGADDLDAIVRVCRDPETVRWTTVPDPYQRSDAEFFVHEYGPGVWARGTGAVFAITDSADAYAGVMELRLSPADPLVGDLGYVVAPWARGLGHCPAAVTAVCAWGFTTLGLDRIEWRANVGNTASRRAVEKAGFTFEGTARHALSHRGVRTDAWVGSLLPADLGISGPDAAPGHRGRTATPAPRG
ncbi:GNAT family N-acetyltransferase [Plantactinospora sp. CA-290183]|uniref:GNAT family N-acetyltransferase n=1 Tax=Plantactinospora sp. CA-290183 TaxID=3240006 RepID=UPI003D8CAE50